MNAQIQYWRWLALISLLGTAASTAPVRAQNITPTTNNGTGTVINNNGQRFDITGGQRSGDGANLFHSFQQFNLDAGQTANFVSAPSIENILGRVTGGNASVINGLIQVTGGNSNLYLMNPAGILFGPNARLDVPASFSVTTATGIGFGNNWFNAIGSNDYQNLVSTPNRYRFDVSQPGAIVNAGNLELSPGQDLTLTGGTVINTGELSTPGGNVTIAAVEGGDVVRISQTGHLLNLEVSNLGGTQEEITPLSLPGLLTEGNANSHATGLTVNESGQVVLTSRNLVSGEPGTAITSGSIDTSSNDIGGEINVLGSRVGILDANINADGLGGGGDVFIGGDFQGNSRLPASQQTVINNNSFISANALENGNGGRVIIWSDGTTRFEGNISATGGEYSGNGGLVEVSGKQQLLVNGFIDVSAANGEAGTILFDPENITVDELAADVETDVADGLSRGEKDGLAAYFEADVADGLLGEEKDGLAADFEADVADGLSVGENTETASERVEVETRAVVDPFAPDADYNVTISAENIESLEGNVQLQADNDITVNQEINTSESVELKAGRSININADIDTSSGNGNISLFGNDNSANVANRSQGAANIIQRENTTINAGSGDITLRLGNLGRVGDINVENLTTTGQVLINANGGNIGRVSPNSLITAGNATFRTYDIGSIGLTNAPLRLDVENLEAEAGSGGAFFEVLGRVTVGDAGDELTGIVTADGGEVVLSAEGKITVTEGISTSVSESDAGHITLESRSDGIDTTASNIDASSELGAGGNLRLTAVDDIQAGTLDTSAATNGGNVTLISESGDIVTGNILSLSRGNGRGGNITLEAGGAIDTTQDTAESDEERASPEPEPEPTPVPTPVPTPEPTPVPTPVPTTPEPALLSVGSLDSSSESGDGGNISLAAGDNIQTGTLDASAGASGGNISIESRQGNIDTRAGFLDSSSNTANGGDILLIAENGELITGNILSLSRGNGRGGNITLEAGGAIDTTQGTAGSKTDNPGTQEISDPKISPTPEISFARDRTEPEPPPPTPEPTPSPLDGDAGTERFLLGTLNSSSENGDGGNITVTAGRDINTANIYSYSKGDGSGGTIVLRTGRAMNPDITIVVPSGGSVNTTAGQILSFSGGEGNGGNVEVTATGEVATWDIFSYANGSGTGGNITLNSQGNINTTNGQISSVSEVGDGGNITFSSGGDIQTDDIVSFSRGSGTGGNIVFNAEGAINTQQGQLESTSTQGDGGQIEFTGGDAIETANIFSFSKEDGSGGSIIINSGGAVNTTAGQILSFSGGEGNGGNVEVTATGNIVTAEMFSYANGRGSGGSIILNSQGNINTTRSQIASLSGDGNGGNLEFTATGDILTGDLFSRSLDPNTGQGGNGNGGNITLNAGGNINTTAGEISSKSYAGAGGNITFTGGGDIQTAEILSSSRGSGTGGNIVFNAGGSINTTAGVLESISVEGDGGKIELSGEEDLNTANIFSFSRGGGIGGNIILNAGGSLNAVGGNLNSGSQGGSGGNIELAATGNIVTRTIRTVGGEQGGTIAITSTAGEIDTTAGRLNSSSRNGIGGDIALEAEETIVNGDIAATGERRGGNVNITSNSADIEINGSKNITIEDGGTDELTGNEPEASIVADSDRINSQSGDFSLEAHNDITINEGIESEAIANLELKAGRNININADIDTSGGNGNITLRANDGGANPEYREPGTGNVTMAEGTTVNAGDGNILIEIGNFGSSAAIGNITLGNIQTTGALTVDANGGNILSVSPDSLITAGSTTLQTRDRGSIGLSTEPLEIQVNNLEGRSGSGGIFLNSPQQGITLGNASEDTNGIFADGGDVEITANGDIAATEKISSSSDSGRAGNILLDAAGAIDTSATEIQSSSNNSDGGNVTLTAGDNINTSRISSVSFGGGNGGNITLESRNGLIQTTTNSVLGTVSPDEDIANPEVAARFRQFEANIDAYAPEGNGGNIELRARGNITTGDISSYGRENSGNLSITSEEGNINAGVIFSTAETGVGGNIALVTGHTENENTRVASQVANTPEINISHIATYSSQGTGGDIEIDATGNFTANNVASFGAIQSGDINITSGSGSVSTRNITTQAGNGPSGNIAINGNNVATGNVRSLGTTEAGQIRIEATDGSITTKDLESISTEGEAGGIDLDATEDIETGDQTVDAAEGDANIDVNAGGDIATGDQTVSTGDGNASINNQAGGDINLRDQIATAEGGNASINNQADGSITAGDQTAVAEGGDASINNEAGGNITAGDQTAISFGGDASINNQAGGNINVRDQTAVAEGGNATITNIAEGDITVGDQTALSESGNAFITNDAGGNLRTGDQTTVAPDGTNQVSNNAGGTINTGELVEGGGDITPFLNNNPVLVVENNIRPETIAPVATVINPTPIVAPTPTVINPTPIVAPTPTVINPTPTVAPAPTVINPTPAVAPTATVINPTPTVAPAAENIPQTTPNTTSINLVNNHSNSIEINQTTNAEQILQNINLTNTNPVITAIASPELIADIEQNRIHEFSNYFGEELTTETLSAKNLREVLKDIEKQTGKRSAVFYINVYPEQLQLIIFTPDGEPISKIVSIPKEQLMETVKDLKTKVTSLRYLHTNKYLEASQQLYQWLIAPIASELEAEKIDNLLFSMDSGLRSLPLAALHDGEQFLIENYSLSLIPSISLIDTRYLSVENNQVLAMGASKFPTQEPLPAVPVELETITQDLWQGQAFLNEEFTRENLIKQRQNYSYPIIHLATHANFNSGDASNSYIELWNGDKLRLNQVRELGWENPTVELLVLSACRTALGDADAELGFAGLAVATGVKSAVASLWYVSDEGTLGLMTEFYSHLDDVTIKAEALRQAQLAMLRGKVSIENGQLRGSTVRGGISLPAELAVIESVNLSHPYYWSGFTMIGSPW